MSILPAITLLASELSHREKLTKWLNGHGCEVRSIKSAPPSGWFSPPRYVADFVDDQGVVYDGTFELQADGVIPVTFIIISGTPRENPPSFLVRNQNLT